MNINDFTKFNLVAVDLSGKKNTMTCRFCKKSEPLPQTDEFVPKRVRSLVAKKRTAEITISTNRDYLKYFIDSHWKWHTEDAEKAK